MPVEIVSTSSRPELADVTGPWRWEQFFAHHGRSRDAVLDAERAAARTLSVLPRTLVLLADGEPAGMASLAAQDLETRPDLGPWLAGVYVVPAARGRGHATRLVGAVEATARTAGFAELWLYTRTAESLYRRCGWRAVEAFPKGERIYVLMRRGLEGRRDPGDGAVR